MGVFGSSDSDASKKLEADIAFIKTRLDLIARQMSAGSSGAAHDPNLDAKLRSIYDAVRSIRIPEPRSAPLRPAPPAPIEGLDEIRADLKQILNRSDRSMHLDLITRLDAIDARLSGQAETFSALKDTLRELIEHLRNR